MVKSLVFVGVTTLLFCLRCLFSVTPISVLAKCTTSVQEAILRHHAYTSFFSSDIHGCYYQCRDNEPCQSINFYEDRNICELNNRTISETSPLSFMETSLNRRVFFFENPFRDSDFVGHITRLGSSKKVPALSCQEIKKSSIEASSGRYWLDPSVSGKPINVYCNMTTGAVVECTGNPCQNGGTCNYQGSGHYTCSCTGNYIGAHCELRVPECITYTKLSNADRNQKNLTNLKKPKCDSLVRGWYRFNGSAGKKMPTQCVPKNHCNTHAPGWMNGTHPQVQDGIVHRTVCFNWLSSCCYWKAAISVRNCSGFYVYYLGKPPACRLRYCGAN